MSASYLVDLYHHTQMVPSITQANLSGSWNSSGVIVGNTVDMLHAHGFTNLLVVTGPSPSGQLRVSVQTSDSTASGTFTDPTSGLVDFPTDFKSGGILWINSGGANFLSGSCIAAGFQRPHRYVRALSLSGGLFEGGFSASFVEQLHNTAVSGFAGFSYSPTSGVSAV